ncbi:MAG: hypothetical protein AVDCRST_MAG12-1979, partial [uncultured Rubrobacteraceae bacterium]
ERAREQPAGLDRPRRRRDDDPARVGPDGQGRPQDRGS